MMFILKTIYYLKSLITILIISAAFASCSSGDCNGEKEKEKEEKILYHTPEQLNAFLKNINDAFPGITFLENAGTSAEGRIIYALTISDNPLDAEPEPKIRITGAIHGDENATTEVILRMIEYLTWNYMMDTSIRDLINSRYIVFIPMMNPDGAEAGTRTNSNYIDLNRNFSTMWQAGFEHGSAPFSEPESQSVRDYSALIGFHLSITFHTGEVIINMPFDYTSLHFDGIAPAEYDLVSYIGNLYATSGRFLESDGILDTMYVNDGTINGGDWYEINGSLQDWSYVETGCIDYTVEISDDKKPATMDEIDDLFELNRDSIIAFIGAAGIGVHGQVKGTGGIPLEAEITVSGGDIVTHSDPAGYYHRVLLPGSHTIIFSADGYTNIPIPITIPATGDQSLLQNITMTPVP